MKNKINHLRKNLDISLKQLSQITGISYDDLVLIEKGDLEPSLLDSHKITKALNKDFISEVFIFDDE